MEQRHCPAFISRCFLLSPHPQVMLQLKGHQEFLFSCFFFPFSKWYKILITSNLAVKSSMLK